MLGKREVRRLRRGVIAFGQEQLPARIHGARGVDPGDGLPDAKPPVRQIAPPIRRQNLTAAQAAEAGQGRLHQDHETQRAPACCRGPAVDFGASGGDGTGDFRTDEPNSGMEQSRTRSNVGATPDVTSWTTRQCSGMSAEIAGLCPYPFPHQIWFEGDAVRVRTVRGLYRRGR
jgi:hypothetical protein